MSLDIIQNTFHAFEINLKIIRHYLYENKSHITQDSLITINIIHEINMLVFFFNSPTLLIYTFMYFYF